MALSQVQCLDDHHVNWRVSESKPEFFYSEDQRLALEALVARGPEGFAEYTRERGLRGFLSGPEVERIAQTAEPYRPGHEHHAKPDTPGPGSPAPGNLTPGSGEEAGDGEVSLQYWPDRSEASVVQLDLGWPDSISYRGVTRVTVHTQPPTDGSTHIKEVVRKSIASAQKVIAVVMDVFTDVDIFRDLLDASYKRKVPVYIIIDMAAVPCFLSMCARADMHRGHLKNLRVRCCGGVEFFTRSAHKVRGSLSQKFLLVDGDRAISGSYSFTWSSSRLDRTLITLITGQAVETFDFQFRDLYLSSRGLSLSKVPMADEPIPDPLPVMAPAPMSAAVARKLINPKYSLVGAQSQTSSDQNSGNKIPPVLKLTKGRLKEVIEEPPLHPGLAHLEKAYLIPYLPTWPEPDPPSDVIGFINIRDEKRANQVHLQRSERFEVSQAIRFSSPFAVPAKTVEPASGQEANAARTAKEPSRNVSSVAPTPGSTTNTQVQEKTTTDENKDQTDSSAPLQPPHALGALDPNEHSRKSSSSAADSKPLDKPTLKMPSPVPPVPKRRTLQLVIDSVPSEQPDPLQVSLVKMEQVENPEGFSNKKAMQESLTLGRERMSSKDNCRDSGSNDEDSQDSTKVLCDRAANDGPSSASTVSEEEFYDTQQEPSDLLPNGGSTGSGRGHRQTDVVNRMARISQSMLDLREPSQSEDSKDLIRQSQQLRRQTHTSPHRHIGQLFRASVSPGRDGRPKVIIGKPGSYQRPARAANPVTGGHRYWQGETLHSDLAQQHRESRSSRSPRRHNQDNSSTQQPPVNSSGLLGVSLSKLSNFRHLRARGGGGTQKKGSQNKASR